MTTSKTRKRKNRNHRQRTPPKRSMQGGGMTPPPNPPRIGKKIKTIAEILGVLIAILGLYATYIEVFSSRISVTPNAALNPNDVFSAPFIVSNDGYVDIHDVVIDQGLGYINNADDTVLEEEPDFLNSSRLRGPNSTAHLIKPSEKMTYNLGFKSPDPTEPDVVKRADIALIISYRPDWSPWRKEMVFRFQTQKGINGQLIWIPAPAFKK